MIFPSDCHVHTPYCDGQARMEAMAARAFSLGYHTLGFSPHSPLPYKNDYAMRAEKEPLYLEKVRDLQRLYRGRMDILIGIEWDLDTKYGFPRYDYRIGSVHQLTCGTHHFAIDNTMSELKTCIRTAFGGDVYAFLSAYYAEVERSCMRVGVDVVGHFDLAAKFNENGEFFDENDARYRELSINALRRIIKRRPDLVFEINTGAVARGYRSHPYPAPFLLREMAKRGARVTLTSDAHSVDALAFMQDAVFALCHRCGFDHLVQLTKNGFIPFPLQK